MSALVKRHKLALRVKNCGVQASQISSWLWLAREVPTAMVIKQGTICRQWRELESLLGGSRA